MRRSSIARLVLSLLGAYLLAAGACSPRDADGDVGGIRSNLTAAERRVRLTQIRDAAAASGVTNGVLLAGIAEAETNLAHCWSEATWACEGPASADCGGGGVIAGAADGPCSAMQGGLGMFQFDAGTYADTLAREGDRILSIAGNVQAAIDFVVAMVIRSTYVSGVTTREEAIAWLNSVVVGGAGEMEWIQTVTHYYNGCAPGSCSAYTTRFAHYQDALHTVWDEMGAGFWTTPAVPCGTVPAAGRVIDDTDACVTMGGPIAYWRTATGAGYGGSLRWTITTDFADPANYAVWKVIVDAPGDYELLAYTDSAYAQSRTARYTLSGGASATVTVDQTAAPTRSLGTYALVPGAEYAVRVDDNTGEPESANVQLVVDALEVRPATTTPPPDAGTPPPAPDAGTGAGGDAGAPTGGRSYTPMRGGCSAAGGGPVGAAWLVVASLALLAVRRRRHARRGGTPLAALAALLTAGCQAAPPDAEGTAPAVVAAPAPRVEPPPVSPQEQPRAGERVVLDVRADGARLAGTMRAFPLDADPARIVELDEAPAGLRGEDVLDARFSGDAIVVVRTDHALVALDPGGTERVLDRDAHAPLSVAGDAVAYARGEIPELEIARADVRTGAVRAVSNGMAPAWSPALASDGRRVVYASAASGRPRLYVAGEDGTLWQVPRAGRTPSSPRAPRWEGGLLRFDDERGDATIDLATGVEVRR